jgi:flagellar motility protein MotE (MotC chaperone)
MKIWCLLLSLVIAVLSGLLAFTAQAGYLPMQDAKEADSIPIQEEAEPVSPLISSQIGLVDELVESLQAAHEDLDAAKLRLDKREKNLQELYSTYLKLRKETGIMIDDLESQLVKVDEKEAKNFKKLSGVYSKMDPASAAQSLKHMEADRVALILSQMDSRAMAAIMDEAVSVSVDGSEYVAQWSDAMRRLDDDKDGA